MISETQAAATSMNDERTGQHRKHQIMRKSVKSYRQVFDSLFPSFPGMGEKTGG